MEKYYFYCLLYYYMDVQATFCGTWGGCRKILRCALRAEMQFPVYVDDNYRLKFEQFSELNRSR